jgi:hypothetical protein
VELEWRGGGHSGARAAITAGTRRSGAASGGRGKRVDVEVAEEGGVVRDIVAARGRWRLERVPDGGGCS